MPRSQRQPPMKWGPVTVLGTEYEVYVAQTGKVTWRAWGTVDGRVIEDTGRSKSAAIRNWTDTVRIILDD